MFSSRTAREYYATFYRKYTRATNFFCGMYGVTREYLFQKYLVIPLSRSPQDWKPWFYLKKAIKLVDEYIKSADQQHALIPTTLQGKQLYSIFKKRLEKIALKWVKRP